MFSQLVEPRREVVHGPFGNSNDGSAWNDNGPISNNGFVTAFEVRTDDRLRAIRARSVEKRLDRLNVV